MKNKRPLIIAHRGYSRDYPENTIAAFDAAVEAGADMIELDVTLSQDGQLVVIHDDTLNRTTDGEGFVCHQQADDLLTLDAGRWFDDHPQTRPIPSLDEVMRRYAGRIPLNIEVKPFFPLSLTGKMQAALDRLVSDIKKLQQSQDILLSSVNFFVLEYLRERDADIRLGLVYRLPLTDFDPVYVCQRLDAWSMNPYHKQLTQPLLESMREIGVRVIPYTIDKRKHMRRMIELGVDGVFTGCIDWMQEECSSKGL